MKYQELTNNIIASVAVSSMIKKIEGLHDSLNNQGIHGNQADHG